MNDTHWMTVYALWQHRVRARKYLMDVEPHRLAPSELERLIVDSFYTSIPKPEGHDIEQTRYLKNRYTAMDTVHQTVINKHFEHSNKRM